MPWCIAWMAWRCRCRVQEFEPGWQTASPRLNCRLPSETTSRSGACMELTAPILLLRRNTELIEGIGQHLGDLGRLAAFNLEAVQCEDRFAVPKQRDRRGRRRNTGQ